MRKLTRTRITLGENLSQPLPSGITQYRIYDMDNDTRDDIVYLTESGELGILYGTTERGKFQYKLIDRSL